MVVSSFVVMEAERIEAMSGQRCADALVAEVARERACGARRLVLVAQWAVLHNGDSLEQRRDSAGRLLPGTEQARTYGGEGTPEVAEFAVHELALLLGLPEPIARGELADVLDLTHRHPLLWARVLQTADCDAPGRDPALAAGMVQAWQARYVARRCRHAKLSAEAARWVDQRTTKHLGDQAWSRFQELVDARIKAADPVLAEQRRREREATKRVTVSRTNDEGLKSLTVLLPAAQIIVMMARIHQIALILRAHGATAPLGELEADAAFLLCTNPAEAVHKLIEAATKDGPNSGSASRRSRSGRPHASVRRPAGQGVGRRALAGRPTGSAGPPARPVQCRAGSGDADPSQPARPVLPDLRA